ncbi:hypothetical protein DICPUDRAFT_146930 [Dictyostelium purpureum]|uniref:Uncharacterized protein n=1 Tax=Dictyostelium purpureum TaxID=5786 RepID=F0Z793_DICPU|nr:uncharacterized protein DICPUDRAFT_146930 [Dictyostelium purpureum]EGC40204.1 hypothetical protein DICPUDRAFT_146930 [Dictyostelium purpureum]|eukprot:XP_003283273.1 hypothetical protein DICPUDRAFT_146930 [Dictyostelium purpureum]
MSLKDCYFCEKFDLGFESNNSHSPSVSYTSSPSRLFFITNFTIGWLYLITIKICPLYQFHHWLAILHHHQDLSSLPISPLVGYTSSPLRFVLLTNFTIGWLYFITIKICPLYQFHHWLAILHRHQDLSSLPISPSRFVLLTNFTIGWLYFITIKICPLYQFHHWLAVLHHYQDLSSLPISPLVGYTSSPSRFVLLTNFTSKSLYPSISPPIVPQIQYPQILCDKKADNKVEADKIREDYSNRDKNTTQTSVLMGEIEESITESFIEIENENTIDSYESSDDYNPTTPKNPTRSKAQSKNMTTRKLVKKTNKS